jgi:hypothetical protein
MILKRKPRLDRQGASVFSLLNQFTKLRVINRQMEVIESKYLRVDGGLTKILWKS